MKSEISLEMLSLKTSIFEGSRRREMGSPFICCPKIKCNLDPTAPRERERERESGGGGGVRVRMRGVNYFY